MNFEQRIQVVAYVTNEEEMNRLLEYLDSNNIDREDPEPVPLQDLDEEE